MVSTIIIRIKRLLGAGYFICNLVFVTRCPRLCIYAEKGVGEQAAKEEHLLKGRQVLHTMYAHCRAAEADGAHEAAGAGGARGGDADPERA